MQTCMPVLMINLGGEMMYILEQRLKAQSIADVKAAIVLHDIIRTMFHRKFLTELYRPQPPFSLSAIRNMFSKIAHSSIMRLSDSSMDKLFDLMCMGVKLQALRSANPHMLVKATLNHLDYLKALVVTNEAVHALLLESEDLFRKTYLSLNTFDLMELRRMTLNVFQEKRVKVSLFLQDTLQHSDGQLVLGAGGLVPHGGALPGTISAYDRTGRCTSSMKFAYAGVAHVGVWDGVIDTMPCGLGGNVYLKRSNGGVMPDGQRDPTEPFSSAAGEKDVFREARTQSDANGSAVLSASSGADGGAATAAAAAAGAAGSTSPTAARTVRELDSLAAMVSADDIGGFQLKLSFLERGSDKAAAPAYVAPAGTRVADPTVASVTVDATANRVDDRLAAVMRALDLAGDMGADSAGAAGSSGSGAGGAGGGDDLLDLMDSVA